MKDTLTSLEGRNIFLNTWLGFLYVMGLINNKVLKNLFKNREVFASLFISKERVTSYSTNTGSSYILFTHFHQ